MEQTQRVNELKEKGNAALASERYDEAVECYTRALEADPDNAVLYSNRSAAHAKRQDYLTALEDAEHVVRLRPEWSKGHSRRGAALAGLCRMAEAVLAYERAATLEPGNAHAQSALADARRAAQLVEPVLAKLRSNPTTRDWLQDPQYLRMVHALVVNPENLKLDASSLQDEKTLATLSALLEIQQSTTQPSQPPTGSQKPDYNSAPETNHNAHLPQNKQLALTEKQLGNECYKRKDFESALRHYCAALEHDPTDITYHNNIAAVYFETKDYESCIKECEKAIEMGRENRADFKLIAKAFTRIGNAYKKLGNWKLAKTYYEKSMSEHRTPEIKSLLSECDARIREEEKKAYVDPVKAEQEKELGNQLFKEGDYSGAVKHYSEAIRRNPDDAKLYSNRAACYTKLAAFDLGLKDCETCLQLDPKFIKGWIRKGKILQGMQQAGKALTAYQKALELDSSNAEALAGYRACSTLMHADPEEVRKRALSDPDVQAILRDPAMRCILDQMQQDPQALSDHLKNPEIAAKIHKLLESGLIAIH